MTEPFLVLRTRSWTCALSVPHVVETMRPQRVRPLQDGPPYVRGAAVVRGSVLPVVDLEALLGGSTGETFGRYVTIRTGERQAVLAVQDVLGVRGIEDAELLGLPPLLAKADSQVVESLATVDSDLLLVLSAGRIVPESGWSSPGDGTGPP